MIGTVISWNSDRGFGFVRDDEGMDFYSHWYQFVDRSKQAKVGQRVEFDTAPPRIEGRSPQAVNIKRLAMTPTALAALSGEQQEASPESGVRQ